MTPKYNSYKELSEAFQSGELNFDDYILWIDTDSITLSHNGDYENDSEEYDEKDEAANALFKGKYGTRGMVEACIALGIPAKRV